MERERYICGSCSVYIWLTFRIYAEQTASLTGWNMDENNKIFIYKDSKKLTKINVKLKEDALWLTQAQMYELY